MSKHLFVAGALFAIYLGGGSGSARADEQAAQPPPPAQLKAAKPSPVFSRVFIGASGGYQSHSLEFKDTRTDSWFAETASWSADYAVRSGPSYDVSGGVRVWGPLAARVAFSQFTDTRAAAVIGSVPHPFFFSRDRGISGESVALKQQEQAIHVGAMWLVPVGRRIELAVFGGPSFFRLERELVEDVSYADAYPYDAATFERALVKGVEDDAIGFHAGADVTYFFSQVIGVGGVVRYAGATVQPTSPANGRSLSLQIGGLQVGGGIRLRFGGPAARSSAPRPPTQPESPATPPPVPEAPTSPVDSAADETREDAAPAAAPTETPAPPSAPPRPEVSAMPPRTVTLRQAAPVFVQPDDGLTPLRTLAKGTRLRVREVQGDWLLIEFHDDRWGDRVGYVRKADCEQ